MSRRPAVGRRLLIAAAVAALCLIGGQPAASAAGGAPVRCLREQTPPAPPAGGAVLARPLQPGTSPNVVVMPADSTWTPTGDCAAAEAVVTHPGSIEVGTGGAVLLKGIEIRGAGFPGLTFHLTSAWGARDDDSSPDLYPAYLSHWDRTTEVRTVKPLYLLREFDSCRDCALEHIDLKRDSPDLKGGAYWGHLDGADLRGATLRGVFNHFGFVHADLRDANLSNTELFGARFDHTRVDRTDFDGADLQAARLTALRFDVPPSFTNVLVGGNAPGCTVFKDTDLRGTGLTLKGLVIRHPLLDCTRIPVLPGSTAPLRFLEQAVRLGRNSKDQLDFDDATFVATAGDHADLAGADLTGQTLKGAKFVGFPANFVKTDFRKDQLAGADFEGADLSGANFDNAKLAGASFRGADLAERGDVRGATFAGAATDLSRANLIDADISGASFVGADLSAAVFSHVLAEDTNFNGVRAPKAVFTGAHIYGNGSAFDSADNLRGADFSGAVLAGNVDENGGFNLTHADLAGATFDGAQCIGCNFTGSTLDDVNFIGAYLPGSIFADVQSMSGVRFHDAWLYCGDRVNSACATAGGSGERWQWPLTLGADEDYGPVPFRQTNLGNAPLREVATCPDGKRGSTAPSGCDGPNLVPAANHAPAIPAPCSVAGDGACPTPTSTLIDTATAAPGSAAPVALAAVSPADWAGRVGGQGVYAALGDGTIRLLEGRSQQRVAGRPGDFCEGGACGDGGPAKDALLGEVTGMAVGLDGSLYLAEPKLHRVRRIDPSGRITTVAGSGRPCVRELRGDCGNSGLATEANLAGPFGVWVDPSGAIFIADGVMGVREVLPGGVITSVLSERPDARSVVGVSSGDLYVTTPDSLVKIDLEDQRATRVVGTGQPGYNGNKTSHGTLAPGTAVQITNPEGLSVTRNGDILFADSGNSLIRAYVPSSGHVIDALAGVVANRSPQASFNGDGHFAHETELNDPTAVAALANEEFVVADTGNHKVRKFGPGPR